jgi:signal peptidase I
MNSGGSKRKRGLHFYRKKIKIKKGLFSEIIEYFAIVAIVTFLAFVIVWFFALRIPMVGDSMEPVLESSQEVCINRLSYVVFNPKRGDVIAFLPKGNEKSHYYIKRVIGLPGETIEIKDGDVYIDGVLYEDPYAVDATVDPGICANPLVLKDEEYFVMGDNRDYSEDSRSGNIGPVSKEYIYGQVWYKRKTADRKGGILRK